MRLAAGALRLRGGPVWRERLVLDAGPGPAPIWLHAASVGELTSARTIIQALADDPGITITTNSITGRDLARGWGLPARLAPFDAPGPMDRFLAAARPRLQLTVEGEFWPVRAARLADAGIPQAMIGARMSARSAARWARLPGLIAPILARITALSAQDAGSQARLLSLGLNPAAVLPLLDLKLLGPAAITAPPPSPCRDQTFLAASTHPGEDAPILDAFVAARAVLPGLRLILAPRHPQRGDDIAALMTARGLTPARRSQGAPDAVPVLLADTLGEMPRWYDRAGLCLTGASLVDLGGHTPWEPAAHACAILHGPQVTNFADSYARLDSAGAALPIRADTLADTLIRLVRDPAAARAMGAAARGLLTDDAGDPASLIGRLRDLAHPSANPDMIGEREPRKP